MKEDRGGLQPQEKMEIILKVLIGLYLIFKLDEKLPMDEATMKVILEFYNYWLWCYLYKFNRWIDKYVLKKYGTTFLLHLNIISINTLTDIPAK